MKTDTFALNEHQVFTMSALETTYASFVEEIRRKSPPGSRGPLAFFLKTLIDNKEYIVEKQDYIRIFREFRDLFGIPEPNIYSTPMVGAYPPAVEFALHLNPCYSFASSYVYDPHRIQSLITENEKLRQELQQWKERSVALERKASEPTHQTIKRIRKCDGCQLNVAELVPIGVSTYQFKCVNCGYSVMTNCF